MSNARSVTQGDHDMDIRGMCALGHTQSLMARSLGCSLPTLVKRIHHLKAIDRLKAEWEALVPPNVVAEVARRIIGAHAVKGKPSIAGKDLMTLHQIIGDAADTSAAIIRRNFAA